MTTSNLFWSLGALTLTAGGLAALHGAWRRRGRPHGPWTAGGWALLGLAGVAFVLGAEGETGVAVGLTVISLLVVPFIVAEGPWRQPAAPGRKPARAAAGPGLDPGPGAASTVWRGVAVALLALPVFGGAALLLGAGVARNGPGAPADQLMGAALTTPLVWGLGMAWACSDPKLTRSFLIAAGLAALGALLFLLP